MWTGLHVSRVDPDLASASAELLQSTARRFILIVTGIELTLYLLLSDRLLPQLTVGLFPVIVLVAAACALSLWLLPRSLLWAQAVWQLAFAAAITQSVYLLREPSLAFLYTLLPLTAAVTVGWQGGALAEGAVMALVLLLWRLLGMVPLPPLLSVAIIAGGALGLLLGWVATHTLLTVAEWSLFSYRQAQQKVEQARDQRLELKQMQQDLILANRELARLSDRLQAMYQVAEEARRAKEEFVANVSHELRTPLNMIIGFSEMITELPQVYGAKLPPPLLADIAAIQRNSQHLAKLVDDVLDLSQVEAGRMALSKDWASLPAIINEAALATQTLYAGKGLYLRTAVAPDLPTVFCDGTRIRQVILNLLSNAGRFMQQGGVEVKAQREGDHVVVSVADTGPGISPEEQKVLFEPFRQLDNARGRHDGSGLGLSISKQFVEMHGGKMWLESQVGAGTTFYFSLPVAAALALASGGSALRWFSPYQEYEPRTQRSAAPAPRAVPRFVLMEQGDALQRLFSRYLDDVDVVAVRSHEQALQEVSRTPARALIVNTPSPDEAPALLERLPHLPYNTPAIACWAPGPDEAARRLGVVRYLIKPVNRDTLLTTLAGLGGHLRTVLLVDDEPEVLQLFARMLSTSGRSYRILQATEGQRALTLLRERRPDVVLLDLVMPGMDGFHLLQEKAQDPAIRDIPVVVTSSRDPGNEAIIGHTLTVSRSSGLSARDLLGCIQAVSALLSPSPGSEHPGRPGTPAG